MKDTGKQYWRSLEELSRSAELSRWLAREFPRGALDPPAGSSRRKWLQLVGASLGLAGLTSCRRPVEHILPASRAEEGPAPGEPVYYATAMLLGGVASGLLVESHDGRPIKVEGNPRHPASAGGSSIYEQAAVLGLYDPDRSRRVVRGGKSSSWEEFERWCNAHFTPNQLAQGEGLWILSERFNSPSLDAVGQFLLERFPRARWAEYEPLGHDHAEAGSKLAFGEVLVAQPQLGKASVVLALDCDFLGQEAGELRWIREFTQGRQLERTGGSMNRLYVVESRYSITGAAADHRLSLKPGDTARFAVALAWELGLLTGDFPGREDWSRWLKAVAADLKRNTGRALLLAGPRLPAEVQALVHWINEALGASGTTLRYLRPVAREPRGSLNELATEIRQGAVSTLLILGGNPVFNAPADLEFGSILARVPVTVRLGESEDETSALCSWHLPMAHFLEAWGDVRALDGTVSIQQPLIQPLFGGRTAGEVLALIANYPQRRGYDIVRSHWTSNWPGRQAEARWRKALREGVIEGTSYSEVRPRVNTEAVRAGLARWAGSSSRDLEAAFYPGWASWDGRFANNGWLQETPEPMTRLTWDNAALLSPATARQMGLKDGELVEIEAGGRRVTVPVLIQPGHADGCLSLSVGYGRRRCGRVGRNVGFDVYPLRGSNAKWTVSGVRVRPTSRRHKLALTQHHSTMEGRPIILEASWQEFQKNPEMFGPHGAPGHGAPALYPEYRYDAGYQWAMSIDLSACVGCGACVVACQAENNIPVVGKQQVLRGRQMQWIRVDRYFEGPPEAPRAVVQPVLCQQCENAPCENVCPVAATTHSPEGLNDMAYNRCVGTRYCSNNCPYKVRRFNFLNFHKGLDEVGKMAFNPDVTVRMRGVMEKCTYCVQRIEEKRVRASREGNRTIRDGEILTACQQACPAGAIVFGNMNDPASQVARLRASQRSYELLGELNTRPRTTYLARIRNPNPELA